MAGLDPAICRLHGLSTIVIPANAGVTTEGTCEVL